MSMSDFHIDVFWSDEDNCYVANIPNLTFCSAFGDTPREALHEVGVAKAAWLATAQAQGRPIPAARYRPAIYREAGADWQRPDHTYETRNG
jgi:predicted RNase H-like HicB family nuclease